MIIRVETANKGVIRGFVSDSTGAVRLLRALARDGVKCVRWTIEREEE